MQVNGNRDILAGKLQEKYGLAKEAANTQIGRVGQSAEEVAQALS